MGEFPGGPVVRTLHFHCRGHGLDPSSGIKTPHASRCGKKKKKPMIWKMAVGVCQFVLGYFLDSGIYQRESGVFFETVMCYLQIYVTMPCTYRMMSCEPLERLRLTSLMDHPQEGKRVAMPFILCFYWNELKKYETKSMNCVVFSCPELGPSKCLWFSLSNT